MRAANVAGNESFCSMPLLGASEWVSKTVIGLLTPWEGVSGRASVTEERKTVAKPLDETRTADYEYTQWHREMWSLLVRHTDAECLDPTDANSWRWLWGKLGSEFFRLFVNGDNFIRGDMMRRAMSNGSWRGDVVAKRLSSWAEELRERGPC